MEKIDVIITTKNRIKDLVITIRHLLKIGFEEKQVYIIDDASEDQTYNVIQNEFPTINIRRNESSKGLIVNRNILMDWTSNGYVLSVDDDSYVLTGADVNEAISILESDESYGIFHFRTFEQLAAPPPKEELSDEIRILRNYIGCGHIISRATIESVGMYLEELFFYAEELDFSIRAYIKGIKTVTKDNLIVHHRIDKTLRKTQKKSKEEDGVYGQTFRFKLLFANNLIVTSIYYPFLIREVFLAYRILLNLYVLGIEQNTFKAWVLGLKRYLSMRKLINEKRNSIIYKSFNNCIKLPLI